VFTLPHAYAPFIEDTTLGIMPKHLWQSVQADSFQFSQLNTHPIGSGPYKVANVRTDQTGAPTRYDLVPFDGFPLGGNYIGRISFAFFPNEDALQKAFAAHQVDAVAGVSPSQLADFSRDDVSVAVSPLPRVFGIFFNQNHNAVLADPNVRAALEYALDKKAIVQSVLRGYGQVLDGPIPPGIIGKTSPVTPKPFVKADESTTASTTASLDTAQNTLKNGGWTFGTSSTSPTSAWTKRIAKTATTPASTQKLSLKLATADEPELVTTANIVAQEWRELGIDVDVQVYPLSDFNNAVLRPRNYDAILFGEAVSRSGDLFAFWHSSQRNDPGLNLALYANSKVDSLLSQARTTSDKKTRDGLYQQFVTAVQKDRPAIFLYSPDFIYIVPSRIRDIQIGALSGASERFLNVYQWYTDTERIWDFFVKK
jgi:peptide/nickel transport system substrate-binding protein